MRKPRETDIVRQCLELLQLRGIPAYRQNQGGMTAEYKGKARFIKFAGAKGISDIIGIVPPNGRYLAVECKMPGKKPTEEQTLFLERIRSCGGLSVVVTSASELNDFLEKET